MSNNLTKRQIVQSIYEGKNYKQEDVRKIVQETLDIIRDALIDGRNIELRKFGVFEIQVRKARVGRNPNKPETDVIIPRRAVVKFKAGKELKEGLQHLDLDNLGKKPRTPVAEPAPAEAPFNEPTSTEPPAAEPPARPFFGTSSFD